jgi:hypothetical protein
MLIILQASEWSVRLPDSSTMLKKKDHGCSPSSLGECKPNRISSMLTVPEQEALNCKGSLHAKEGAMTNLTTRDGHRLRA